MADHSHRAGRRRPQAFSGLTRILQGQTLLSQVIKARLQMIGRRAQENNIPRRPVHVGQATAVFSQTSQIFLNALVV